MNKWNDKYFLLENGVGDYFYIPQRHGKESVQIQRKTDTETEVPPMIRV